MLQADAPPALAIPATEGDCPAPALNNKALGSLVADVVAASTSGTYVHSAGAYAQREEYLMRLEAEGDLGFHYVTNNGQPQNMIW